MIDDLDKLIKNLNSPADWAIVGAAGLAGFVLDATINIVPLPLFSPGVCGLTAAGGALTIKRGWEARQQAQRQRRLLALWQDEARRVAARFQSNGQDDLSDALLFEQMTADVSGDATHLEAAVRAARARL